MVLPLFYYNYKKLMIEEEESSYAGILMSIVPVIITYLIFQKQLMTGTTSGAIKG